MLSRECPFKQVFAQLDADHDGKITPKEIMALAQRLKVAWTEDECAKRLCILNPLGIPELPEDCFYLLLKCRMNCPCAEKSVMKLFDLIDTDKNGELAPKEVMNFYSLMLPGKKIEFKKVAKGIYKYDKNGDMRIGLTEFMNFLSDNLKAKIVAQTLLMFATAGDCCKK